jgi:hypothetical protein
MEKCGEGCGREAMVNLDDYTFCETCLKHLALLGRIYAESFAEATPHIVAVYGPPDRQAE